MASEEKHKVVEFLYANPFLIADTRVGLADSQYLFGFNKISWSTGWPVLV